jgi:hypothetical protein
MPRAGDFRTGRHVVFQLYAPFGPCAEVSARCDHRAGLRHPEGGTVEGLRRFRGGASKKQPRARQRPPHDQLPAECGASDSLKGVSAHLLRSANLPQVRNKLGDHFWSPSYCAVSCGGAPLEIVAKYIQSQSRTGSSPSSKAGFPPWESDEIHMCPCTSSVSQPSSSHTWRRRACRTRNRRRCACEPRRRGPAAVPI